MIECCGLVDLCILTEGYSLQNYYGKEASADKVLEGLVQHKKSIMFGIGICCVLVIFAWVYFYKQKVSNQAGTTLLAKMIVLTKSASAGNVEKGLQDFDALIQEGVRTNAYPHLLAGKASFLAKNGKYEEAASLLQSAADKTNSELFSGLYLLKKCQIKLLSDDEEVVSEGLAQLQELSMTSDLNVKRFALYVLHKYFWDTADFDKALLFGRQFLNTRSENAREVFHSKLEEIVTFNVDLISLE